MRTITAYVGIILLSICLFFTIDAMAVSQCGDGICYPGEEETCPGDCPPNPCNNDGICDAHETSTSCPGDCNDPNHCGNGVCEPDLGEDMTTCSVDCGFTLDPDPDDHLPPTTDPASEYISKEIGETILKYRQGGDTIKDIENSPLFPEFAPSR